MLTHSAEIFILCEKFCTHAIQIQTDIITISWSSTNIMYLVLDHHHHHSIIFVRVIENYCRVWGQWGEKIDHDR